MTVEEATAAHDRAFLEGVAAAYLEALVAGAPGRAPLAPDAVYAENDQRLPFGLASWRTIEGLGRYRHLFADPEAGQVAAIANVVENGAGALLVVRLGLREGLIAEAEQFVIRDPNAFQTYEELGAPDPIWLEPVPEAQRQTRRALEAATWMYFQALERNDGAGIYPFLDDCQRLEHGRRTVDRPSNDGYGHADAAVDFVTRKVREQYEMGMMAFVTRIRDRRVLAVDVERGAVLGTSVFDFDGKLERITFADGRQWEIPPYFRTPRSHHCSEAFKVLNGSYRYIEMTLLEVPFATLPVWRRMPKVGLDYTPAAPAPQPQAVAGRADLIDLVDRCLDALVGCCPCSLPLAQDATYTENGVPVVLGEGLWRSVTGLGRYRVTLADPSSGQAACYGALEEHGLFALAAVRLRVEGGLITEIEAAIARPEPSGKWGQLAQATHTMFVRPLLADLDPAGFTAPPDPALAGRVERPASREDLLEAVDRYFQGFEAGRSGDVPLSVGCRRRENGVLATDNPRGPVVDPARPDFGVFAAGCAEQLDQGYLAALSEVRRRPLVVDEELGLVLHLALLDHPADVPTVKVEGVGEVARAHSFGAPSTDLHAQLFKVEDGAIRQIEGLVRRLPYGASSPWDAPLSL